MRVGNQTIGAGGSRPKLVAIPDSERKKPLGVTIDWSTVLANVATKAVQLITITGSPTGGTFTVTYGGQTTSGVAYNASASTLQTALEALSSIGSGNVAVSGSNGGPYTVTFQGALENMPITTMTASGASLTGGTSPGVTIVTLTNGLTGLDVTLSDGSIWKAGDKKIDVGTCLVKITASGKYGPALTSAQGQTPATDGRETIASKRGDVYLVNHTIFQSGTGDVFGDVIDSGQVYQALLKVDGVGQPTKAQLEAAFPNIAYVA